MGEPVVLAVDDDSIGRRVLRDVLQPLGVTLVFAQDGEEALSLAEQHFPDLVLLDLMLPDVSGFEVIARLRQHTSIGDVPIILLTAYGDRENRLRGLRAGADDFLSKPFDREELRARVTTTCRLARLRRREASRQRFEQFLEQSPDGMVLMDEEGHSIQVNEAFRQLVSAHRLPAGEDGTMLGVPFIDLLETGDRPRMRAALERLESMTEGAERFAATLRCSPPVPVEITAIPGAMQQNGGTTLVVRDISSHRRLEQELRQTGALGGIGQIAAEVTHDVAGLLDLIQEQLDRGVTLPAADGGDQDTIRNAVHRARTLTRSLLRFGRPSAGVRERLVLGPFLERLATFMRHLVPSTLMLTVDVAADVPAVMADVPQLEQALLNLVLNARAALGGAGRIELAARTEGRGVSISVADDGPGISESIKARIGHAYVTTRAGEGGTGLGLAVVRRMAESHGGSLRVDQAPDRGARFVLWLPSGNTVAAL